MEAMLVFSPRIWKKAADIYRFRDNSLEHFCAKDWKTCKFVIVKRMVAGKWLPTIVCWIHICPPSSQALELEDICARPVS